MEKNTKYPNIVEFEVEGDYAQFTDPLSALGGEKTTLPVPTYEALKGIMSSIYYKPTLIWVIDNVRIMNPIRTESRGVRVIRNSGGNDLSYRTFLKHVKYQVRAHFVWNTNRPELSADRNENKHHNIAKRMIKKGGRRDVFFGNRECQAYVRPCVFGEGEGAYDSSGNIDLGFMYHGITYADEAYSPETQNAMTTNFWYPVMIDGVIDFVKPEDCPYHRKLHDMKMKPFGFELNNFSGLKEFDKED